MKTARLLAFLFATLASTACFQMEYALVLQEDLSGTAGLDVTIDLEQMAVGMASVQRSFGGEEGPPSAEEIAAARENLLAEMEDGAFEEENIEAEVAEDLPAGVELLGAHQTTEGLRTSIDIDFRFDHISLLNEMDLAGDEAGPADSRPFGGLEVVEEGNTIVIRQDPINPIEEAKKSTGMMGGMEGLVADMFKNLRIAFTLEAPFEIVEHNATSQTGRVLSWIYDYETLTAGTPEGVYVRYRR
jgi:hypothetical protein